MPAGSDLAVRLRQDSAAKLQLCLSQGLPSQRGLTTGCAVDSIDAADATGIGTLMANLLAGGRGVAFSTATGVRYRNGGAVVLPIRRGGLREDPRTRVTK